MVRICSCCKLQLPDDCYSPSVLKRNKIGGYCKKCNQVKTREWKKNNRHKLRSYDNAYYQVLKARNPARFKETRRGYYVKIKYGLSRANYDQMLSDQNYLCAICRKDFSEVPCVDHCHTTNINRGILCRACNIGLGNFADNTEVMFEAISYLLKFKTSNV